MTRSVALSFVVLSVVGCSNNGHPAVAASRSSGYIIAGNVAVIDGGEWTRNCDPRFSSEGHEAVRQGAQVVVENATMCHLTHQDHRR